MSALPSSSTAPMDTGHDPSSPPATLISVKKARARAEMLTGPVLMTMLTLALPTVLVLIAQTGVGIAETYYVSFLGTEALAGVSLVFPVLMLMTMMSNGGIGGGVASAVARAIGAGRNADADALVLHALVLGLVFGLAFTCGVLSFGPSLYRSLGGTGNALTTALLYSTWVFAGAVPIWIVNLLASALRGAGNVRAPALVIFVGALVLIPVSPALIFGIGPIPRFGVAGAGIAVAVYYTVAAIVLIRYLLSGRAGLTLKRARLEIRLFKDILRVGLIAALSSIQPNLTVLVVTAGVGLFGIEALAGYGIASRLDYILIPLMFGLGTAVVTMVGTNIGAKNLPRARRIAWTGAAVGGGVTALIGLIVAIAPSLWLRWFSRDEAVLAAGASYLRILGPVYVSVGVGMLLTFAAQGGGRVIWPFLGGTLRMVIAAGLGWAAVVHYGASLQTLFLFVAIGLVAYAATCVAATLLGKIWRLSV
jgi:putative MATE family efflux protein